MKQAIILTIPPELIPVIITSLLILCARVIDVSLGTMRIICVSKGRKRLASALGFVEILVWLVAINQVMQTSSNVFYFLAYATGFALGNFLGILIEGKVALGTLVVQIITSEDANALIDSLSTKDFGITTIDGMGKRGPVKIIYTVIKRKDLGKVTSLVKKHNPKAFYSVEEVQAARKGIFPVAPQKKTRRSFDFIKMTRKAK